jgi:hypothetical protein
VVRITWPFRSAGVRLIVPLIDSDEQPIQFQASLVRGRDRGADEPMMEHRPHLSRLLIEPFNGVSCTEPVDELLYRQYPLTQLDQLGDCLLCIEQTQIPQAKQKPTFKTSRHADTSQ